MIGHNPKANAPTDELPEIAALLSELPRVSAPTDFNASLQARLASAKAEAHEFAGVTALLKELPRVAAPSDFDFKLRARIAQAKATQQEVAVGWFAKLFGGSFSWGQTAAAMAAVAIVVSVVMVGVLRNDQSPASVGDPTTVAQAVDPTPSVAPTAETSMSVEQKSPALSTNDSTATTTFKAKTIRYGNRPTSPVSVPVALPEHKSARIETAGVVTTKVMIKSRSGEARMVNLSEYNLGLQTAQLRAMPKAATNPSESAMANIY
jgi:hypothetical protein